MSSARPAADLAPHYAVSLPAPDDFDAWRDAARQAIQCRIAPERLAWLEPGTTSDLFGTAGTPLPTPPPDAPAVRASKPFLAIARDAALHSDPARFDALYALLWRLQANPQAMEDKADPHVRRVEEWAKAVRRDSHKMHAFVRFRAVSVTDNAAMVDDGQHYVAWFEPDHHIVRANAGFFVRRFANMRWSILTPRGSLHWDGETLSEGPPAQRSDAPGGDPTEDLWRSYYSSIFNPARLKVGAMLKEMPRKYWKNLPEAELIPQLVAGAQAREAVMVAAGEQSFGAVPRSAAEIAAGTARCRACPIGALGTQAVPGEGPLNAMLMIVGEQPGDQEDIAGRPFVGPAGQVLDRHLAAAGIARDAVYLTNAVKHFKYVPRGKRRLHQTPTAKEIDICRWWLDAERSVVRPPLVLALGASAARGLLGRTASIARERGRAHMLDDGSELWITAHPSYLLRLEGEAQAREDAAFAADLAAVAQRLRTLESAG